MTNKERFVKIYTENIKRDGADKLLDHLCSQASDFFTAPASARYHCCYEGGLCEHSLNVYDCLKAYMERERVRNVYGLNYSDESIAVAALLHDLCKMNVYKPSFRNVKGEDGVWHKVPAYEFEDKIPYGHGEKSVYIASGFMRLTRDEAFAIRYHMGFSGNEDARNVGDALRLYPLAFALMTADMEASYFMEK